MICEDIEEFHAIRSKGLMNIKQSKHCLWLVVLTQVGLVGLNYIAGHLSIIPFSFLIIFLSLVFVLSYVKRRIKKTIAARFKIVERMLNIKVLNPCYAKIDKGYWILQPK